MQECRFTSTTHVEGASEESLHDTGVLFLPTTVIQEPVNLKEPYILSRGEVSLCLLGISHDAFV